MVCLYIIFFTYSTPSLQFFMWQRHVADGRSLIGWSLLWVCITDILHTVFFYADCRYKVILELCNVKGNDFTYINTSFRGLLGWHHMFVVRYDYRYQRPGVWLDSFAQSCILRTDWISQTSSISMYYFRRLVSMKTEVWQIMLDTKHRDT